jgi:uncharacterized protein (TIGR02001 family)
MRFPMARCSASIALAAAALAASAAAAQDAPPAVTLTAGATITSDYRFRGISQTNKRFAIQGTLGVTTAAGFYVGTWGSSIDDYVAGGSDQEIDLYGGFKKAFDGTTVDVGLLYYYYPGSGGINSDFFEPYANVSHSFGPVGVKVGGNFSWKQHALSYGAASKEDAFYGYGELSAAIPNTGFTVTGHLGRSFSKNYITFGTKYTDYSVTAAYTWKNITGSVSYVDTNKQFLSANPTRDVGKGGVVASIGVAF